MATKTETESPKELSSGSGLHSVPSTAWASFPLLKGFPNKKEAATFPAPAPWVATSNNILLIVGLALILWFSNSQILQWRIKLKYGGEYCSLQMLDYPRLSYTRWTASTRKIFQNLCGYREGNSLPWDRQTSAMVHINRPRNRLNWRSPLKLVAPILADQLKNTPNHAAVYQKRQPGSNS